MMMEVDTLNTTTSSVDPEHIGPSIFSRANANPAMVYLTVARDRKCRTQRRWLLVLVVEANEFNTYSYV